MNEKSERYIEVKKLLLAGRIPKEILSIVPISGGYISQVRQSLGMPKFKWGRITSDKTKQVGVMLLSGKSPTEILNQTGASFSTISLKRRQLGLPALKRGAKIGQNSNRILRNKISGMLSTHTQSEIAEACDISRQRVNQILNGHKHRARALVSAAVRSGKLERPKNCQKCDKKQRTQAHHDDYSKPLSVRWLCKACHSDFHQGKNYTWTHYAAITTIHA